eukprot:SAG22_NODE_7815_length_705_cov_1.013201_1_plen_60_part_00
MLYPAVFDRLLAVLCEVLLSAVEDVLNGRAAVKPPPGTQLHQLFDPGIAGLQVCLVLQS